MSEKGNGNVRGGPADETQREQQVPAWPFKPGDIVALTGAALRIGRLETMTPRALYQLGRENRFLVIETFETADDGPCVMLSPCCFKYVDRRANGMKPRCKGHPVVYFEKVGILRAPKKGDKASSLTLPILGELFGLEWQDDEENPRLNANVLGLRGSATGFVAKFLKKLAEDKII